MLRLTIWSALLGRFASVAVTGSMSERELEVRARELDLRERELDLRELELAGRSPGTCDQAAQDVRHGARRLHSEHQCRDPAV